jgi:hypothetical protein
VHEICRSAAVQQDHQRNNLQARPENLDMALADYHDSDDMQHMYTKINI